MYIKLLVCVCSHTLFQDIQLHYCSDDVSVLSSDSQARFIVTLATSLPYSIRCKMEFDTRFTVHRQYVMIYSAQTLFNDLQCIGNM